ncbi:HDL110Cp [Eremothecium sinecaudum]|uniref:HDL110Cp n=1 Tax=Eremothecium sinecaudum TaxID=45286 RepID=A0A0X8HSI4_9SACH|nr:HDL110Cp [Eremothecium sinecaudum]AMD20634.1 HDL110Cp [Eremothecium sinecaudum]
MITVERNSETSVDKSEDCVDENGFSYPDGGLKAWIVTIGAILGIFSIWGMFLIIGMIELHLSENQLQHESTSTIAWIFSVYTFFYFSSGIFSGLYFDRYGLRAPVLIGSALYLTGVLLTANATKVWHFIISFGCLVGISSGVAMNPLVAVISHYFYKKRGLAISLAISGGTLGGVAYSGIMGHLFRQVGFAWAMRLIALISLCALSIMIMLVREDPAKLKVLTEQERNLNVFRKTTQYIRECMDCKAIIHSSDYRWFAIATCAAEAACGCCITYLPRYMSTVGYDEEDYFLVITALNLASVVGGISVCIVADRWLGHFNAIIIVNLIIALAGFSIWLPAGSKSKIYMYVFSAIYGACYGPILMLVPVCCGKISRTDEFCTRYSTVYVLVSFTFLVTIPISAGIIGKGSLPSYKVFVVFISTISALSSVLFFLSKLYAVKTTTHTTKVNMKQTLLKAFSAIY